MDVEKIDGGEKQSECNGRSCSGQCSVKKAEGQVSVVRETNEAKWRIK